MGKKKAGKRGKGGNEKVYQVITDRLLKIIEENKTLPWHKPWGYVAGEGGGVMAPINWISKKPYRGINVFMLHCTPYERPYWLTFKQAMELRAKELKKRGKVIEEREVKRGKYTKKIWYNVTDDKPVQGVKKGEESWPVVFWKWLEKTEEDKDTGEDKVRRIPMLRYYQVFNIEQTTCRKPPKPKATKKTKAVKEKIIKAAEDIVKGFADCPPVAHRGNRACYSPMMDKITMPVKKAFKQLEEYYGTLFHEMAHSTGHSSRCDRGLESKLAPFGSVDYSKEELVAEFTAAFLCGNSGILPVTVNNSAAYLKGWAKELGKKENVSWLVCGAAQAQKAADYILGVPEPDWSNDN